MANPSAAYQKASEIKHTGISRVLTEFLEERQKSYMEQLIGTKDADSLRQLQGRAQELSELIKFFKA